MMNESDLGLEYIGNAGAYSADEYELRQINKKLKDDYNSLKHQFDEAVKVSEQVDALCEQNTALSKKNRELQATIDELERRIEISSRLNDELNSKLQQAKQSADSFMMREMESLRQQLESKDRELDDLKGTAERESSNAQNVTRALEKEKVEKDVAIEAILSSASRRFGVKFTNLYLLSDYLQQVPVGKHHCVSEVPRDDGKASAKIAKLKRKNKDLRNEKKLCEAEISRLKEKLSLMKKESEEEASKAMENANDARMEQKLAEVKSQQIIEQLQKEKRALEEQVAAQKVKISEITKTIHVSAESVAPADTNKVAELSAKIDEMTEDLIKASKCTKKMKKRAAAFAQEIQQYEAANGKLKRKNAALQSEIKEVTGQMGKIQDANKALVEENGQLKDELEASAKEFATLNQQCLQAKAGLENAQAESRRLDRLVGDLEGTVEQKVAEINGMRTVTAQQQQKLAKCEIMIKEQSETIESMEKAMKDLRQKHDQEKPVIIPDEIPQSSWFCVDFPKDLCKAVTDIAKNDSIHVSARLRQALTTIAKYYSNSIQELEKSVQNTADKDDKTAATLQSILSVIHSHFGEIDSVGNMSETALARMIDEKLNELSDEKEQLSIEKSQLTDSINTLVAKIGADSMAAALSKVGNLVSTLESQAAQMKRLKGQNKQLKKAHNQMVKQIRETETSNTEHTESYTMNKLMQTQSEHTQEIEIYKLKVAALEQEVARLESEQKRKAEELEEETQERLQFVTQQVELQCKNEAATTHQAISQELARTTKQLKEAHAKITKLKRKIEHLVDANDNLQKKCKSIRGEAHDAVSSLKDKFAEQMNQTKDKHNADISTLQSHLAQKDDEIRDLHSALDESKQALHRLSEMKRRIESERNQFASKVTSQCEEMDRERRLLASKFKTLTATTDLRIQDSLDDLTAKFEQEKRNIYHFGADLFKSFFDPRVQLTDESYKKLLQSAKDELSRMQKQETTIRRLVGALHSESAEDALARAIAK